jgi:energy-coupling factor transport system ATP-binding protein
MAIHFREVSHHFQAYTEGDYQAIRDVTFSLSATDEFVGLVGQTGSGKSTLAQHMNALLFPSIGEVEIFDKTVTKKRNKSINYNDIRRDVGLVFQFPEYQLFEETVEKDIMFGPRNFGVDVETAKEKAKEAIRLVGLDESYLKRNPLNLSGGEKKRVSIAGILAIDPKVLVFDEPTSGLDPHGKHQLMALFEDIRKKTKKSIVMITHDMDLVYAYCTRALVLRNGELMFDGSVDALFSRDDLDTFFLDKPHTIRILEYLKTVHGLPLDTMKKTPEEAARAIEAAMRS